MTLLGSKLQIPDRGTKTFSNQDCSADNSRYGRGKAPMMGIVFDDENDEMVLILS